MSGKIAIGLSIIFFSSMVGIIFAIKINDVNTSTSLNNRKTNNNLEEKQAAQIKSPEISDEEKLSKRILKWQGAEKCTRAMISEEGKVSELCQNFQDIYRLTKSIGVPYTNKLIKHHLEQNRFHEKQLKDGIISKLPFDKSFSSFILTDYQSDIYSNSISFNNESASESKTCIYEMEVKRLSGQVVDRDCLVEQNQRRLEQDRYIKEKIANAEKAIKLYDASYVPSP